MEYDKNSFLAGISVGMTMKGWAGGGSGGGNTEGGEFKLQLDGVVLQDIILQFGSMSFTDLSID